MRYIFILLVLFSACSSKQDHLIGSWKLTQVYDRSSSADHSMTTYIKEGSITRTLSFNTTECVDVLYRDGKLSDSITANYRIAGEGKHLSLFHEGQMVEFWEILSVGKDLMKLLSPSNMVYVFTKLPGN
jgi:hypothetical protein